MLLLYCKYVILSVSELRMLSIVSLHLLRLHCSSEFFVGHYVKNGGDSLRNILRRVFSAVRAGHSICHASCSPLQFTHW